MLFTSFLIFLVFSTFPNESLRLIGLKNSHSIIVNRLGTLTIIFTLIMLIISTDIVALSPGITLYNNWFSLTPTNLPIFNIKFSYNIINIYYK